VSKDKNKSNGFKSGKEGKTQSLPKRAVNIMQIGFYLHNNNPCSNEEDEEENGLSDEHNIRASKRLDFLKII